MDLPVVRNSKSLVPLIKKFKGYEYEVFLCVALDQNKKVIATHQINGGPSEVSIQYDEVLDFLNKAKAKYFIVLHNHPSTKEGVGVSDADDQVTFGMYYYFNTKGYELLDHLVFTDEYYFSYFNSYTIKKYKVLIESNTLTSENLLERIKPDSDLPNTFYNSMLNDY